MQKSKFLALLGILAVFMTLVACPPADETSENEKTPTTTSTTIHDEIKACVGQWINPNGQSPYDDWFSLSSDYLFKYYNNSDPTNDIAYNGKVINTDLSGDYLFLNIQITDISRSPWGLTVGHYARIALQKINANEYKMSTGTVGTYPNSTNTAATLDELKKNFTIENGAYTYFGTYRNDIPKMSDFIGSWASTYGDWFSLTSAGVFTCYNNGDTTSDYNPVPNDIAYKGTVESYDVSGDYVFLNLKVADPSRSPWGLAIDEYARVCLKAITNTQCQMATGTVGEYPNNSMTASTLSDVKTKFSFESGAYTYFGTYNKK